MSTNETYKVYSSKTGVLHVSDKQDEFTVFTFGTWKNGKVSGACRKLDASKLTPAGYVHRIGDVRTYYPEPGL